MDDVTRLEAQNILTKFRDNPALAMKRLAALPGMTLEEMADIGEKLSSMKIISPKKDAHAAFTVKLASTPFDKIEAKAIDWLFERYLPYGMLVTIFAPKGRGKTKIMDFLSACATTGRGWPGGLETEPTAVLRFNMEDPEEQILRPSLQAAGANLSLVRFMDRTATAQYKVGDAAESVDFSRQEMVEGLKSHIAELKARLVIVEPINNYKGGAASNSEDDMRPIYMALARVAAETGACVIAINHSNKKKDVDVLDKSLGAGSGPAVARANFFLEKNPDIPTERILTNAGSNIPVGASLVFIIESAPDFTANGVLLKDVGVAKFIRHDNVTADELLERVNTTKKTETNDIEKFLIEALPLDEEVPTEKIKALALSENREWKWGTIRQVFQRRNIGESVGPARKTRWVRRNGKASAEGSLF